MKKFRRDIVIRLYCTRCDKLSGISSHAKLEFRKRHAHSDYLKDKFGGKK